MAADGGEAAVTEPLLSSGWLSGMLNSCGLLPAVYTWGKKTGAQD